MPAIGWTASLFHDPCNHSEMRKHFVRFFSPGTFFHEITEKPIAKWDIEKAKEMASSIKERYNATPFAFQFFTMARTAKELNAREVKTSPMYYLGGRIETLEEVKARATEKDRILISNMEGNGWHRIITNDNSWRVTQPLEESDIVLEWP